MAETLSIRHATIISVILVVVSTIIWFAQGGARVDLSSDSTFFAIAMAAVFVGAVWAWYTLPWKGERDHD